MTHAGCRCSPSRPGRLTGLLQARRLARSLPSPPCSIKAANDRKPSVPAIAFQSSGLLLRDKPQLLLPACPLRRLAADLPVESVKSMPYCFMTFDASFVGSMTCNNAAFSDVPASEPFHTDLPLAPQAQRDRFVKREDPRSSLPSRPVLERERSLIRQRSLSFAATAKASAT